MFLCIIYVRASFYIEIFFLILDWKEINYRTGLFSLIHVSGIYYIIKNNCNYLHALFHPKIFHSYFNLLKDEYSYTQDGYGGGYDRMEHMVPDKVKKVMAYMQDMIADRNINEVLLDRLL